MNTQPSSSTIKINLPAGIRKNAQDEAKRIGISLQDFIRMLMATYFSGNRPFSHMPHEQKLYDRAQKEIRDGTYTEIRNKKELKAYLDKLSS